MNKLSTDNKVKTTLIKYSTASWKPHCVYSSPATGDLLVGMCHTHTGKVYRYNSIGENIQAIPQSKTGQELYSKPIFITENRNGDVIVSDVVRGVHVVVTDREGSHRFSYTGPPIRSVLSPGGICTDALSHILVCDGNTKTVQMLDCDGQFLSQMLTSQHSINKPWGLSYDDKSSLLWLGSADNTVNIFRHLYEDSLTDTSGPSPLPLVPSMAGFSYRLITPSTLKWSGLPSTQERPQLESTNPWTAPSACFTSTSSTLEQLGPPSTQERHQPESTHPWTAPSAYFTSTRSTLEQLGSLSTQDRGQGESTYPWNAPPAHLASTKHPIKFEKEIYDLPSCSSQIVPFSGNPPPKKIRRTGCDQKLQIKETTKEFKVDVADFQSGSTEIVLDDTVFLPLQEIKSEIDLKYLQEDYRPPLFIHEKYTSLKRSTSMNLIDALESETLRSESESVLCRIEYVDCNDICGSSVKHCSIGQIETCREFNAQGIFGWTKSCSEEIRKARTQKCKCFISTYCFLITIKVKDVLANVKVNELQFVVKLLVDFAIESRNYILLSELVRLFVFHCDFQLETLFMKTNKKINNIILHTILQSAKCMILRKYASLLQNSIQLSLCHDCGRGNLVTIVFSYKGSIEMIHITQEKVMGKKMFIYNRANPSNKAYVVFKSCAASHLKQTLHRIPEKEARELFKRHSNLTMISASPYKSIGYSKGKQRIVEKPCILLLCLHKGYIPYGEVEFSPKNRRG